MLHSLGGGALTAGQSINSTVSGMTVNGLIIAKDGPFLSGDTVQITLKSDLHPQKILVNSISLDSLAYISDLEYGQSQTLQAAIEAEVISANQGVYSLVLPLGCLKLRANKSELEVMVKSVGSATFSLTSFFDQDGVDHAYSMIESRVLRDNYSDVSEVFIVAGAPLVSMTSQDLTILVETPKGNYVVDQAGALAYNLAKCAVEAEGAGNVIKVFQATDAINDECEIQITGSDSPACRVITRQTILDPVRISNGTIEAADTTLARMSRMGQTKERAYRRAGLIPARSVMMARRELMTNGTHASRKPLSLRDARRMASNL